MSRADGIHIDHLHFIYAMADTSKTAEPKPQSRPLDESLYSIDDQALQFMREQTGIQDPEELKKHIFAAQAKAYAVRLPH